MASGYKTIHLHGRDYAIGIFWQLLSKGDKKEIVGLAEQLDFDLHIRDKYKEVTQVGYASHKDGALVKAPSLALQLLMFERQRLRAEKIGLKSKREDGSSGPSFLMSFQVDSDAWYLLEVKNGVIQPDTDCLCNCDNLIARIVPNTGRQQRTGIYIDQSLASLDLQGARVVDFAPAVRRVNKAVRLQLVRSDVNEKRRYLVGISSVLTVAALGAFAFHLWMLEEEKRQLAEAQARLAAATPPVLPQPPWETMPLARDFVSHCLSFYQPVLQGGWELVDFECDGSSVKQSWDRNGGHLFSLYKAGLHVVFDSSFQKAMHTTPIPKLPVGKREELRLGSITEEVIQLHSSSLQVDGMQVKFSSLADIPPSEGVVGKIKSAEFEADLQEIDPRHFVSIMPDSTRLKYMQVKSNKWTLKGVVYGYAQTGN